MFGLSTKEKLYNLILNTSQNHIGEYISAVKDICDQGDALSETQMESECQKARRNYLDGVSNDVFHFFNTASPKTFLKLQVLFVSPSKCGFDDEFFDLDNGLTAGAVYALCYYAMKDKSAKPYDCSKLSHLQNDIMQQALLELSENM